MAATNVGLDWLEFLPSDNAQQLSAWACVRTRSDPERCELPLCMGHSAPSAQQAIRASGVALHPAHIAAFPATRANVSATAARRWTSLTTAIGCSTVQDPVKRMICLGFELDHAPSSNATLTGRPAYRRVATATPFSATRDRYGTPASRAIT